MKILVDHPSREIVYYVDAGAGRPSLRPLQLSFAGERRSRAQSELEETLDLHRVIEGMSGGRKRAGRDLGRRPRLTRRVGDPPVTLAAESAGASSRDRGRRSDPPHWWPMRQKELERAENRAGPGAAVERRAARRPAPGPASWFLSACFPSSLRLDDHAAPR